MKIEAPSVPHLLHIETTYSCNQNCRFCYNPAREKVADQAAVRRIIESVYRSWVPHVYLIGGEPSMVGVETLNKYIELLSGRSSVTIVTNAQIYLDGLSQKLACLGVPIHGCEATHDYLTKRPGSFRNAISSIRRYVERGFDVRCIPVLTSHNFDQLYDTIRLARDLGMESIFVDRFEDGGLGSLLSSELKPNLEQFRIALGQMIAGRDAFGMPVGWGTAIPYCLDERLISEDMSADCGAGITFCAVNPQGEARVCNQSQRIYGNVLEEPIETIWHKPALGEFRDLEWVEHPCKTCQVLTDCLCGCKVDANYSDTYSVDYAVRGQDAPYPVQPRLEPANPKADVPLRFRRFSVDPYTRLNTFHREKYLITRYQTVELDEIGVELLGQIIAEGVLYERALIARNGDIELQELREFLSRLELVDAIKVECYED